jgi:hypothetical protein
MWFGDALRYKGAAMGSEKKDHGAGVERKKECGTEVKERWRRGRRGGSGVRLRNMKCSRITRNTSNSIKIINKTPKNTSGRKGLAARTTSGSVELANKTSTQSP